MRWVFVVAAAWLAAGAARAAPLEAFGALPTMSQVAISPDGTKIAFVQPLNGKQAVVVDQLNPAASAGGLPPTDQKVRALIWADPTHLLVVKSQAGYAREVYSSLSEWYLVYCLDLEKHKVTALFNQDHDVGATSRMRGPQTMNVLSGGLPQVRMVGGHPTVFGRGVVFVDSAGVPALLSADLITGRETIVETAVSSDHDKRWLLDNGGRMLAQTNYDEVSHIWTLRLRRGSTWVDTYSANALNDPPELLGISPDGASLMLELTKADGEIEDRPVALATGALGEPQESYEALSSLIQDPVTHRIIGGVKMGMEPTYVFFDPKDQAAWDAVVKTFPDEEVELADWSDDRTKVVVQVTGVLHGVVYDVVDLTAHKAMEIGQLYGGIKPDDLAEVHLAKYAARDGTQINAFLTLPNGKDFKNLPLIVMPHGGPAARDGAGFDWWAQALASRGYAVLQPQFRGSYGFGWKLESAGFGEFGRKMQTDLSDGVAALAAKGYIDPKRVCIVGASYGGYAALAGVTLQQGVYRCAVAVAGLSDMHKFVGGSLADASRSSGVRFWDRFVGAKSPTDPLLDQISPVHHAAEVNAPILLIHGRDDSVVPYDQSERMQNALKAANKPVEFVTLSSEDHWLSREETRLQMLRATIAFLEKNNPPQ